MLAKRTAFNPKRRIAENSSRVDLEGLAASVRYGGNPEHKRNPGDFGLTPPASPRRDKTRCDGAGIFHRKIALGLLQAGIRSGLVSESGEGKFPKNIWAVAEGNVPLEAQLENAGTGTYHGYPMPLEGPFRDEVLSRWKAVHG